MSHNQPAIACIVVTYHRERLLNRCLKAIINSASIPNKIFIIDNGSSSAELSQALLDNTLVPIIHVRNHENTGGAGGFKKGMELALAEERYDYLWIMDDDVEPDVNCLTELLKAANPKQVTIPYREYADGTTAEYASIYYDFKNPFLLRAKRQQVCEVYPNAEQQNKIQVQAFAFEGPLIPVNIVEHIGLPNARFFIFGDDTDFALRAIEAGYSHHIICKALLQRNIPKEPISHTLSSWKAYYVLRNIFLMDMIHGHNWAVRTIRPIICATAYTGYFILKRQLRSIGVTYRALVDAYKERKHFL